MAASCLLLSYPCLTNSRIIERCMCLSSNKEMRCFTICLQKQCNFKPWMPPAIVPNRKHMLKDFAIHVAVTPQEDLDPSGVLNGSHFMRSVTLSENPSDGLNGLEGELQEFFDEVKTMFMAGNKDDAMDLLQANYEVVKEQINAGSRGIQEAATLDVIALGYMGVGELKYVEPILNLLNTVIENVKDDEHLLDLVLIHMGSMYAALGKLEESISVYQRAIGTLEMEYGKSSTFLVSPLLGMAKVLGSIGKAKKAIDVYHHVIRILEARSGADCEDLVVPVFNLANLLVKEGRNKDAEVQFTRILSIYQNLYGENDGRVSMALCSLAHVKCSTGNVEEAIDMYKRAIQIIKDTNYTDVDDNIVEKMRIDLAELLHVVGRGDEGRELLEESLLIAEKYRGEKHPSTISHLLNLATSYSQSKNYVEAERLLRACLEIMNKTVSPDDQSITFPMLHLAATLYSLNRDEEAEQLALEVLRIREKAFGEDSVPVGEALDCLICIQSRAGRGEGELLELLRRVLKIQEREFGYESEERRLSKLKMKYKQMVQY
ncbi:Tetratricopeptide repeat (TPR)-like superfamily protein [Euphorbia peplus]|nr:Tetratricopeptide repeat (TPR)-like superfamily protein [Euphorbia peplus]